MIRIKPLITEEIWSERVSTKGCLTLNCARLGSPQRGERAGRSTQGGVLSTGNVQQPEGFMMQFET